MVSTSPQACLTALVVAAAFWAMFATDAVGQGSPTPALDGPLRSINNGGTGHSTDSLSSSGRQTRPSRSFHPATSSGLRAREWIGISVSLHVDDLALDGPSSRGRSRGIPGSTRRGGCRLDHDWSDEGSPPGSGPVRPPGLPSGACGSTS